MTIKKKKKEASLITQIRQQTLLGMLWSIFPDPKQACECGWEFPRRIVFEGEGLELILGKVAALKTIFTCPRCAQQWKAGSPRVEKVEDLENESLRLHREGEKP